MRRAKRRSARHSPACRHCPRVRLLGRDYQAQRAAWETRLEQAACGYATEAAEFRAHSPAPTFKTYLIAMTGTGWPMSGHQPVRRAV